MRELQPGSYWLGFFEDLCVYNLNQPFTPPCELNVLLEDPLLADLLYVAEVRDNEICLQYQEGNFQGVLLPGRYPFWKGVINYDFRIYDLNELDIPTSVDRNILQSVNLINYVRVHVIQAYEEGLLFVQGKYVKKLIPGTYYFWKNEQVVSVMKADLRHQQVEINGQEMLTKDKATLRINLDARYRIVDTEIALIECSNFAKQLYAMLQLALREYVGTLSLDELLSRKTELQPFILEMVQAKAASIGGEVLACGMRDVILPGEMKEILNQVLIAEKKAQANTITRREETASTRSLLNTAKLMEDNEMLYKLKEMEYVEKIADKINSISVAGGGQIVDQLRDLFGTRKE